MQSQQLIKTICQLPVSERYDAVNKIKDQFCAAGNARNYPLQDKYQSLLNLLPHDIFDSIYRYKK